MTFDPFRPDDAGDESARFDEKQLRRPSIWRVFATGLGLILLVMSALVAVLVAG
jgi:hypothetical protein